MAKLIPGDLFLEHGNCFFPENLRFASFATFLFLVKILFLGRKVVLYGQFRDFFRIIFSVFPNKGPKIRFCGDIFPHALDKLMPAAWQLGREENGCCAKNRELKAA